MIISIKETVVRWHSIEVDETELGLEEGEDIEPSEIEDYLEIREQMWEDIACCGWDGEYVLEATWIKGEPDD